MSANIKGLTPQEEERFLVILKNRKDTADNIIWFYRTNRKFYNWKKQKV